MPRSFAAAVRLPSARRSAADKRSRSSRARASRSGLSLAVGLVVDDAVMVMENIYRHAEMGKPRAVASAEGTKEITFAALAATLAVVAIFLPVVFMEGVIGRFFFQFGVTLSVAVMLSYFEAITLAPARCAQILSTSREGRSALGRAVGISANVAPGHSQAEAMAKVAELAKELPLGYRAVPGGQASQLAETTSGLFFALAIGILVAYMVLASQFNSFLHPVTVLTILPLALSGAAIGLLITGKTLNVFSMIGVLLLMGIVKKNSILLVEYANQVSEHEGLDALSAMRKAGPLRLRPILMTTIATMMAAVPPVLGIGPGTETRSPMAAVVLGGLTVSTLLSLIVVPAFYVVANGLKEKLRPREAAPAPPVTEGHP
jgi:multidrug efflux pump subunit AcrB